MKPALLSVVVLSLIIFGIALREGAFTEDKEVNFNEESTEEAKTSEQLLEEARAAVQSEIDALKAERDAIEEEIDRKEAILD